MVRMLATDTQIAAMLKRVASGDAGGNWSDTVAIYRPTDAVVKSFL
jgi:hypothetical protein